MPGQATGEGCACVCVYYKQICYSSVIYMLHIYVTQRDVTHMFHAEVQCSTHWGSGTCWDDSHMGDVLRACTSSSAPCPLSPLQPLLHLIILPPICPSARHGCCSNVVGLPGGVHSPLFPLLQAANVHGMELREGSGNVYQGSKASGAFQQHARVIG